MRKTDRILKVSTGSSAILAGAMFLSGILGGCASARLGITEVAKPDLADAKTFVPRKQATPPKELTENTFVDTERALKGTVIEEKRGYALFSRPITKPVYRGTHPLSAERTNGLATFATQGEYEPLTFSFYPLRDLDNVRLVVSSLKSADSVIQTTALDLRAVTYWNIRYPRYTSKNEYRAQPELLEKVNAIDLKKNVCQRFWLKIHVPTDAKPGLYKGAVTIYESGQANAWQLPLTLRVLDYKLKRDPAKRYSVYYSFPPYQSIAPESPKWDKARENEFKAMLSYGIDMFPTVRLRTRMLKNGEVEVYIREERNVDKMVEMGFKGPIPVTGGMWHFYHNNTKGGKILSHWRITKKPKGNAIYKSIERSFRKLREKARKKGWPELICCPMDEVSPTTADFASKVFAAIRRSGMKTYATKDPTSSDAAAYRKLDAVYAWCSQPFGFIYDKVTADKNHEYWIYPNHNAGEIKNRVVMQKGGRMTYGFGLWKSGYTTVIPWHWRWITDKKQHFNYMSGRGLSGCGARVDDKLQVIPAVYWECFREGYDDLRYLYTLQDAIVKREGSENKQCRTLVDQGKKLVQKIWNSIPVKKKYLNVQKWTDENFQVRRWQIASLTQKLLAYPTTNDKAPLSVPDFVRESQTASKVVKKDVLTLGLKNGWIDIFNLGDGDYKHWRAVNKEASKKVTSGNPATLQFKVDVDHKIDGGGEKGKYPIGWPRISRVFKKGALDLTKYDYLSFKVKVDSDRSEVEDDVTPFIINFASYAKGVRYDLKLDFGDKPRVWLSEKLSIADMISKSGFPKHDWCDLRIIQLVIAENFYADKTKLVFDFRNLALLKFNRPILKSIICGAVLLNSDKNIVVRVDGYGLGSAEKRGDSLVITVKDSNGKKVHSDTTLFKQDALFVFDASKLNIGTLKLELSIIDSLGKSISSISKKIEVIKGF